MNYRPLIAALVAGFSVVCFAGQAEAGKRLRYYYGYEGYYPGPEYIPPPRYYPYFPPAGYLTPEEYEDLYGDDFDESYYDPYYDAPPVRKLKPAKKKAAASPPAKRKTATVKTVTPLKTEPPVKTAAQQPLKTETPAKAATQTAAEESAPKSKTGALSCDKASSILSGYGFSDIKAASCTGHVYAFNATRDGKPYAVKLNAANGELTEVRKVR